MRVLTESPSHTWQPTHTKDTTTSAHWLNWRFFLCVIWILISLCFSVFLILKREYKFNQTRPENEREAENHVYDDQAWNACLQGIHPSWLLIYRLISFLVLLALLIANVVVEGANIFYFYT